MDKKQCLSPEEVGFHIQLQGTWLKWITMVIGLGIPAIAINLASLAWNLYTRIPLLPDSCIEHILEVEEVGVRRLDIPCEQQTRLLARRMNKYLFTVQEARTDAR